MFVCWAKRDAGVLSSSFGLLARSGGLGETPAQRGSGTLQFGPPSSASKAATAKGVAKNWIVSAKKSHAEGGRAPVTPIFLGNLPVTRSTRVSDFDSR